MLLPRVPTAPGRRRTAARTPRPQCLLFCTAAGAVKVNHEQLQSVVHRARIQEQAQEALKAAKDALASKVENAGRAQAELAAVVQEHQGTIAGLVAQLEEAARRAAELQAALDAAGQENAEHAQQLAAVQQAVAQREAKWAAVLKAKVGPMGCTSALQRACDPCQQHPQPASPPPCPLVPPCLRLTTCWRPRSACSSWPQSARTARLPWRRWRRVLLMPSASTQRRCSSCASACAPLLARRRRRPPPEMPLLLTWRRPGPRRPACWRAR